MKSYLLQLLPDSVAGLLVLVGVVILAFAVGAVFVIVRAAEWFGDWLRALEDEDGDITAIPGDGDTPAQFVEVKR